MGAQLKDPQVRRKLDDLQKDTKAAASELEWEMAQSAVDLAGLVDPTPISDGIGKTARGARALARVARLRTPIADKVIRGRQIVANALKKDAEAMRAKRVAKRAAEKAAVKAAKIEDSVISGSRASAARPPRQRWR